MPGSADEALLLADAFEFELVVVEICLHEQMNGYELAARLGQGNPSLRVVLSSGLGLYAVEDCGIDPESVVVIAKPFGLSVLVGAVERAYREERGRAPRLVA